MQVKKILLISIITFTASALAMADNSHKVGVEKFDGSNIRFSEKIPVKNTTLSISGPNGFFASRASENGIPAINLFDFGAPSDGRYRYQITSATLDEYTVQASDQRNNGRVNQVPSTVNKSVSQSGYFTFENGQIKQFESLSDAN